MRNMFFISLLFLSVGGVAADGGARKVDLGGGRTLLYEDELGGRYQYLTLVHDGAVLHKFRGVMDKGGLFEYERSPVVSSDGSYVVVNQVEAGLDQQGRTLYEMAYCELIDLESGCIAARGTGQFCGGEFTGSDEWKTFVFQDLNLSEVAPTAEKYVSGRLNFSDSPGDSLENLLVCDPPADDNVKYYKRLVDERFSGWSDGSRNKLRDVLTVKGYLSNAER